MIVCFYAVCAFRSAKSPNKAGGSSLMRHCSVMSIRKKLKAATT